MRILLRAGKRPEDVVPAEAAFQRNRSGVFGSNSGNMFFWNSVYRALNTPQNEVVPNGLATERPTIVNRRYIERIDDEFDHLALPFANAFRTGYIPALEILSEVIERLHIPVTVIGVGAQLEHQDGDSATQVSAKLAEPVTRFARAVLDHSAKIGVRGEFTRAYLATLGFGDEHVEVIGCPSLLDRPELLVEKPLQQLERDARLSFNSPQHLAPMAEALQWHLERYPDFHFVQQDHRELAVMMWGEPNRSRVLAPFPSVAGDPMYADDRVRFFLDPAPWERYLAQKDFSFGSRIHGNIAALRAGTPATVLAFDSRTLELAEYHRIPVERVTDATVVRAAELYERADFTEFHAVQRENFERYTRFLDANGLSHIHTSGNENPAYDRKLAAIDYGAHVQGIMTGDRQAIVARLNWLWQGIDEDQLRLRQIYRPEFVPDGDFSHWETTNKLLRRHMTASDTKLRELEATVAELRAEQERQAAAPTFAARVARRVKRMFGR